MTENESFPRRSKYYCYLPENPALESILKHFTPLPLLLSCGVFVGALLPTQMALAISLLVILTTLTRATAREMGVISNPSKQNLIRGRYSATLPEDEFVVFLVGTRSNSAFPMNKTDKKMGDAMKAMMQELEAKPELGCLAVENYGGHSTGSDTLYVQYWKSVDHLQKFAQDSQNSHYSPWKWLMRVGRESDEVGFWHETFKVNKGEYEAIYVNLPRIHLAGARGADVRKVAHSKNSTMSGRLGKGTGVETKDWPKDMGDSTY